MKKKTNPVVEAILEMNDDQLNSGLIDQAQYDKITARMLQTTPQNDSESAPAEKNRN